MLGREGGRLHTDRLGVLVVGDRGGQPQQGEVMGLHFVFGVYDDVLYSVPARIGLPVPERWLGGKLPELNSPLSWIKEPSEEEERSGPSGGLLAT